MLLTGATGIHNEQPVFGTLSPSCEMIRVQAVATYWKSTVNTKQAARMIEAMSSGTAFDKGMALVREARAGRITVQQLGASTLAGADAVSSTPLCGEDDRQIARKIRLVLPPLMLDLAGEVSAKRMSKQ